MAEHTPGPWTAGGWSSGSTPIIASDSRKTHGRTVALVPCEFRNFLPIGSANEQADYEGETTRANAHLIAAAPELLAALANLVERIERQNGWDQRADGLSEARAAIAKAEGR